MKDPDELNRYWRDGANYLALKVLASLALGHLGWLETALPDAAHGAQQAAYEKADAKERGGTGGRKAEKAGTSEPAAQHVPIGGPDEDSACIDPETLVNDRPNPEQELEAHEEEEKNQEDARRAFRIAFDRWGLSGLQMLEALMDGSTDKEAAEAAGISAPALIKRRKAMIKLRNQ